MTTPDARTVLALPLEMGTDAMPGIVTIRDYLIRLLSDVWKEGEGFNGKRPFGNSGWEWDLIAPLVRAGLIDGKFDEEGYLEAADDEKGRELIASVIKHLDAPA